MRKLKDWWMRKLSRRLLILILGMGFMFSILMGYLTLRAVYYAMQNQIEESNLRLASLAAKDIGAQFDDFLQQMNLLRLDLEKKPLNIQASTLLNFRRHDPLTFSALYVFNYGAGAASQTPQIELADPLDSLMMLDTDALLNRSAIVPASAEVLAAWEGAKTGVVYLSHPLVRTMDKVPLLYVGLPIHAGKQQPSQVVVAEVDLRSVWKGVDQIYTGESGRAFVTSHEGLIIAHPDRAYIGQQIPQALKPLLAGYEGQTKYTDPLSGRIMLVSYSPISKQSGWGLVIEQEESEALAIAIRIAYYILGLALLMCIFAFPFAVGISRSVTRPIIELAKIAQEITLSLDLSREIRIETQDEVSQLALAFNQMIASLRQQGEDLIESEARYRNLFEDSPISLWEEDYSALKQRLDNLRAQGVTDFNVYLTQHPEVVAECAALVQVVDVNKTTLELFAANNKAEMTNNLTTFFTEESYLRFRDELLLIASGATRFEAETLNQTLLGRTMTLNMNWAALPGYENDLSKVIISKVDISARKQAEEALREKEEQYRAITESSSDYIMRYDKDFRHIFANQKAIEVTGLPVEQYIGKTHREMGFPAHLCELWEQNIQRVFETGEPSNVEFEVDMAQGMMHLDLVLSPEFSLAGSVNSVIGVSRDITKRKQAEKEKEKLQEQLLQSRKMESVGRLAGGVAHDFNNMLGIIMGNTESAMSKISPEHRSYHALQEISKAARRSANLTNQLLAYARKQIISPIVLDLNDTVSSMFNMLQRLLGEDIDMLWRPAAHLWHIKVDPSHIDQIMVNLLVNARDAIDTQGRIIIETDNVVFNDADFAQYAGLTPGDYVLLTVSDNGSGMDRETLANIFEPFFTTKEVGKGSGMGLATVFGIVKQNKGNIYVYSEPGNGTTFKIYLPRAEAEPLPSITVEKEETTVQGTETVLLVEDEESLLELAKDTLEELGYVVLAANTPNDALRLAKEHHEEIDLLFSDVVMPGMDGQVLAEQVKEICPRLKCLFMSGYTADIIAKHGILEEDVYFIQKPFSLTTLAVKIRQILEKNIIDS